MKLSRRGLFGLGAGLGLAVVVGKVRPQAEAQSLKVGRSNGPVTVLKPDWGYGTTFTTRTTASGTLYVKYVGTATSGIVGYPLNG